MNNDVKLWLAGELEWEVVGYHYHIRFDDGSEIRTIFLDTESDTPDAAYLREKVEELLAKKYGVFIRPMTSEDDETHGIGFMNYIIDGCGVHVPLEQERWHEKKDALNAAVEWLYERREA